MENSNELSPKGNQQDPASANPAETIFSKEELIEAFSIDNIHKAGAKFDFEKAKWFNAEYIKKFKLSTCEL